MVRGQKTSLILHPGQAFLFIGGRGDCAFDSCPPCNICSEIRALEIRSDAFFNNDCPRSGKGFFPDSYYRTVGKERENFNFDIIIKVRT